MRDGVASDLLTAVDPIQPVEVLVPELQFYPETDLYYARMHVGSPDVSGYWITIRHGTFGRVSLIDQCRKDYIGYFLVPDDCWVQTDGVNDSQATLINGIPILAAKWRVKYISTPHVFYAETKDAYPYLHIYRPNSVGYHLILRGRSYSKSRSIEPTRKDYAGYFELPPHLWVGDEPEALLRMAVDHEKTIKRHKDDWGNKQKSRNFKIW